MAQFRTATDPGRRSETGSGNSRRWSALVWRPEEVINGSVLTDQQCNFSTLEENNVREACAFEYCIGRRHEECRHATLPFVSTATITATCDPAERGHAHRDNGRVATARAMERVAA
ncbi:hypothetical protein MRX96_033590 [Rhipicephalus microplus]